MSVLLLLVSSLFLSGCSYFFVEEKGSKKPALDQQNEMISFSSKIIQPILYDQGEANRLPTHTHRGYGTVLEGGDLILTNRHVIAEGTKGLYIGEDKENIVLNIRFHPTEDLALIRTARPFQETYSLLEADIDVVPENGYLFSGESFQKVSLSIIDDIIYLDILLPPGFSGLPVFSDTGKLIGIVTAISYQQQKTRLIRFESTSKEWISKYTNQ